MYLVVKFKSQGALPVAQLTNNAATLGNTGPNFIGCNVGVNMELSNGIAANNSHKASILPENNTSSDAFYVDKIQSIEIPTLNATTTNYLSIPLNSMGINSDIIGVQFLGLNKTETSNVAAFSYHRLVASSINFSVSKNRLIIEIYAEANTISGSVMNLRITFRN